MTEKRLSKKIKAALPTGWTLRNISTDRGTFIVDCPEEDYYKASAEEFTKTMTTIGKAVDSQPVTTGALVGDVISTTFRIGSLKDPERIEYRENKDNA